MKNWIIEINKLADKIKEKRKELDIKIEKQELTIEEAIKKIIKYKNKLKKEIDNLTLIYIEPLITRWIETKRKKK